ncbi:MAG: PrsW family intramembrane metalloprotease [Anaerolineae bacterium]|nr:PrsW family intramembrane metalloprotease [Anaerolineae bacterium]
MKGRISDLIVRAGWGPDTVVNLYTLVYFLFYGCFLLLFLPKTGPALLFPAYFVTMMLVVTIVNRSLPLRWIAFCFIYGSTIVVFAVLILAWPIDRIFSLDSLFRGAVLIPMLEETVKILPLLALLAWAGWRFRWTAGASDLMALGAALGAGYALVEDTLLGYMGRISAADYLLQSHGATPHLGPLYLFPSMDVGTAGTAFMGHAATTAFVALAIGLARLLAGRLGRAAWMLPVAAWCWVIVEHGLFNYVADVGRLDGVVKFIYTLDANGRLASIVFYLVLLGVIIFERGILWRYRGRMAPYAWTRKNLRLFATPLLAGLASIGIVNDLRAYLRELRGLNFGLYIYESLGGDDNVAQKERVTYLEQLAAALAVWKAKVEVAPSLPLAEEKVTTPVL